MCYHTEIEQRDQDFCLSWSHDTNPTNMEQVARAKTKPMTLWREVISSTNWATGHIILTPIEPVWNWWPKHGLSPWPHDKKPCTLPTELLPALIHLSTGPEMEIYSPLPSTGPEMEIYLQRPRVVWLAVGDLPLSIPRHGRHWPDIRAYVHLDAKPECVLHTNLDKGKQLMCKTSGNYLVNLHRSSEQMCLQVGVQNK